MPRLLRLYLVGCIAITFGYLVLHVREPLRLNVGDPWSDANVLASVDYVKQYGFTAEHVDHDPLISDPYHPTHYPPLAEIAYGVLGKLGVGDIATFRMFALACSALAMWLLFHYARRIWGDPVAVLATALFSTSLLWMMYADSLGRPPIMHAGCFLALWGLVRGIETQQRRHYLAVIVGSFACMFAAYDDWVFLPAGLLFTIYVKRGNPLGRGRRGFVLLCAIGGLAAVLLKSRFATNPGDWQAAIDRTLAAPLPTLVRRYTLVFTPMFWIPFGYTAWRAVRARSLAALVDDGLTWLLAVAVIFLAVSAPDTASPMLQAQPWLPFYAIGSAILIVRLFERGRRWQALAVGWAVVAPVWAFYLMLAHPRALLERADVAQVNAYLAANDRNDFVMSNLMSDGPIQAAFARHSWPAPEADDWMDAHIMQLRALDLFEAAGTDYVHAVIFTTPASRFLDRSLGQLVIHRQLASVTGWPYLIRPRANTIIRDYDERVRKNLDAVGAKRVLHLSNFDLYRIERAAVLALASQGIPVVRELDFGNLASNKHKLLGWGNPWLSTDEQLGWDQAWLVAGEQLGWSKPRPAVNDPRGVTSINRYAACPDPVIQPRAGEPATNACETELTPAGLRLIDQRLVDGAQLMIRVERACDLQLRFELATVSLLAISVNGFKSSSCDPAKQVTFIVPRRSVRPGVNLITLDKHRIGTTAPKAEVVSLAIEPLCEAAP